MSESGAGLLELAVLDFKLDKTIMEKQISIVVEIDNRHVDNVPVSRANKKMAAEISGSDEIMELKICAGSTGKEGSHIGMLFQISTAYLHINYR